jgi:hypothetical protein
MVIPISSLPSTSRALPPVLKHYFGTNKYSAAALAGVTGPEAIAAKKRGKRKRMSDEEEKRKERKKSSAP